MCFYVVCASVQGKGRYSRLLVRNILVSSPFEGIVLINFSESEYILVFVAFVSKQLRQYLSVKFDFICEHGVPIKPYNP